MPTPPGFTNIRNVHLPEKGEVSAIDGDGRLLRLLVNWDRYGQEVLTVDSYTGDVLGRLIIKR